MPTRPLILLFASLAVVSCCHCECPPGFVCTPEKTAETAPAPASTPTSTMPLGANVSLGGLRVLSADSAWNTPIDREPVDPHSAQYIAAIGADVPLHPDYGTVYDGRPMGIPYVVVAGNQPKTKVVFDYPDESDAGPYPIPAHPPIEGMPNGRIPSTQEAGGDQHLIMIDRDNKKLYELYLVRQEEGVWKAGSGAIFALLGDTHRRPGWTSADAAGLPIFPGLVRYDEAVERGKIEHALRFTSKNTRRAYVAPATHFASKSDDPNRPPMGVRLRLKASIDPSSFSARLRPVIVALQRYGMILADNGGNLFLNGAPDPRWNDEENGQLKRLRGHDFEVVKLGDVVGP